jgi:hypothetical protein
VWLVRLRLGPFEGPAIVKPPLLVGDTHLTFVAGFLPVAPNIQHEIPISGIIAQTEQVLNLHAVLLLWGGGNYDGLINRLPT